MKCLSIEERLVLVSNENERLYDLIQAIVRDQRQAMQVLEAKIPLPEIEEAVVEEEKVLEVPKEKTEEDYSKEMAAKIDEMFYLIDQVNIESPLAPVCESCKFEKAEFYCNITDEG